MEQTPKTKTQLRGVGRPPKVAAIEKPENKAQTYAMRIWDGQSRDLPRAERVARVAAGLGGQGMTMDGVVLPLTHDSKLDEAVEAKLRAWNQALPSNTTGIV
ncbi:MAG: hypothetical protein V4858_17170 [Pseudomonadota bacterium]